MRNLTTQEISSVSAAGTKEVLTDVAIAAGASAGLGLIVGVLTKQITGGILMGTLFGAISGTTVSLLHEYDVI